MQKTTLQMVLLCFLISFPAGAVPAGDAGFGGKIAFLRSGEIWVVDQDGGNGGRVTDSRGRVENFLFSPSLGYVAYSRRIKTVEEPGLWEKGESPPRRPVCSIAVLGLKNRKIIYEMVPPEGEWIYIDKWMPKDRLLGHRSSGFDVSGFFVLEARERRESELDYQQGGPLLESDFTPDGSLQAYVKDTGVGKDYKSNLYLVDLKADTERPLLSKRSVVSPKISPDKTRVAFFEVEYVEKKYFDNLWIYDIQKNLVRKLYHGPAKPKFGGVSDLAWSPDGRHIAVYFPSYALLLEIENPAHSHRIPGKDLSWVSSDKVIYSLESRVYTYSLAARKAGLFLENAARPMFLNSQ